MLKKFIRGIKSAGLFEPDDRILLGVSGGMDSVFMTHLFYRAGFQFGIAHCNFMLRGKDSDEDERFVRNLAEQYQVPVFVKCSDTGQIAGEMGISVQMAAREIRYRFFEEIIETVSPGFKYVATAHHLNDQIETFFINLSRGSGIKGLAGIPVKTGHVIRPVLQFTKYEIENYINDFELEFRNDQSNDSDDYFRNRIRHFLIPALDQISTGFNQSIAKSMGFIEEAKGIYNAFLEKEIQRLLIPTLSGYSIRIDSLLQSPSLHVILHEILQNFGFRPAQIKQMASCIRRKTPGKQFFSKNFQLLIDREVLIIMPCKVNLEEAGSHPFIVNKNDKLSLDDAYSREFEIEIFENPGNFTFERSPAVACFDLAKLTFPVFIRKWEVGDKFNPLGMKGFKKISDFLIDKKINLFDKEKIQVLISGEKIIWMIGHRIDGRFAVTPETRYILKILIKNRIFAANLNI